MRAESDADGGMAEEFRHGDWAFALVERERCIVVSGVVKSARREASALEGAVIGHQDVRCVDRAARLRAKHQTLKRPDRCWPEREPLLELAQATDADGDPIDAGVWIAWAINAPAREWVAACRAVGWDPAQRPARPMVDEFGHGSRGSVFAAKWAANVARLKEQGRHIGGY